MTKPFDRIANHTARYFTHRDINCMIQLGMFTINGCVELPENHPWLNEGTYRNSTAWTYTAESPTARAA